MGVFAHPFACRAPYAGRGVKNSKSDDARGWHSIVTKSKSGSDLSAMEMTWTGALRPSPVTCGATRSATTCGEFRRWRKAQRVLRGLNLPQAVPCNLLLHRRAAMVQQVLKVLFRGLQIVLCQSLIPQANFFAHARALPQKTVNIPLRMDRSRARRLATGSSRRRFCGTPDAPVPSGRNTVRPTNRAMTRWTSARRDAKGVSSQPLQRLRQQSHEGSEVGRGLGGLRLGAFSSPMFGSLLHDRTFPDILRLSFTCRRPHWATARPVYSSIGRRTAGTRVPHIPPPRAWVCTGCGSRSGHAACPGAPYSGTAGGSRCMPALASASSAMGGALDARCALAANRRCALSCCFCWRARSFARF